VRGVIVTVGFGMIGIFLEMFEFSYLIDIITEIIEVIDYANNDWGKWFNCDIGPPC